MAPPLRRVAHGSDAVGHGPRLELIRLLPPTARPVACQRALAVAPHVRRGQSGELRQELYRLRNETLYQLTRSATYQQVAEQTGLSELLVQSAVRSHLAQTRR